MIRLIRRLFSYIRGFKDSGSEVKSTAEAVVCTDKQWYERGLAVKKEALREYGSFFLKEWPSTDNNDFCSEIEQ